MSLIVDLLSPVIMGFLMILFVVILICIYLLESKSTDIWFHKFSDCDKTTAQFRYIVRIFIDTPIDDNPFIKHKLSIAMQDNQGLHLAGIQLDGKDLQKYGPFDPLFPNKSVIRFILHTSIPLTDLDVIVLNMKSRGTIKIFNIEIQNIYAQTTRTCLVGVVIRRLSQADALKNQTFIIQSHKEKAVEESALVYRSLNCYEYTVFIFMTINVMAVLCSVMVICVTADTIACDHFESYTTAVFTGLAASGVSALVLAITISIYRYVIKYKRQTQYNSGFWKCCRIGYLVIILMTSILSALFAAIDVFNKTQKHESSDKRNEINFVIYWSIALITGIAVLIIVLLPMLSLMAYMLNFYVKREDIVVEESAHDNTRSPKPKPILLKAVTKSPVRSPIRAQDEDDKDAKYLYELMSKEHIVKSISQYKGLSTSKTKLPVEADPNVRTTTSTNSGH